MFIKYIKERKKNVVTHTHNTEINYLYTKQGWGQVQLTKYSSTPRISNTMAAKSIRTPLL